ncbi:MAG: arsenite methyltransferase [Flavobacteriales bacterium]|nr:arsenite methyltransferase [Flavobacteriales bacterium]
MNDNNELKEMVRQKYTAIANQEVSVNRSSCCGAGECSTEVYNIMTDDYSPMDGYVPDADLGLGCGLPTEFAGIKEGDTVVDLGSGAGNDAFVARAATGADGRVIGIDFSEAMITKAKANAAKLDYGNVEFRLGDLENIPMKSEMADVVVSNCVLNLVPDKPRVFSEMFRIMKVGGHFSVSDIVLEGELPEAIRQAAEMYAGCVSGAIQKGTYLDLISKAGFVDITVQKEKVIFIPDDILLKYMDKDQIETFRSGSTGIYSITVFGRKAEACCGDGCCA